jgi:hypothetical protein
MNNCQVKLYCKFKGCEDQPVKICFEKCTCRQCIKSHMELFRGEVKSCNYSGMSYNVDGDCVADCQ